MSGTSNGSVTPKASAKPKFSVHVKELLEISQRLSGFQKELTNVDRLLDEKKLLEGKNNSLIITLTKKDEEIARMKITKDACVAEVEAEKNVLHIEFEKRYLTWHTGTTKQEELEAKIIKLELQLGNSEKMAEFSESEAADLKEELASAAELLKEKDKDLADMKKTHERIDRELTGAVSKFTSLQKDQEILGLTELSSKNVSSNLGKFAAKCHGLAKHFFLVPLPKELANDDLCMKLKLCGFTGWAPKRTIISDSLPSQYLRTAAALKIIVRGLCTHIFKPYYLPNSVVDRRAMDVVLDKLSQSNPYEEAVFRVGLISAYKNEETDYIRNVSTSAVEDILKIVEPLLKQASRETFQLEIRKLFKEAVELWLPYQRSRTKIVADSKLDDEWGSYEEYDTAIEPNEEHKKYEPVQGEPTDVLFPRVYFGSEVLLEGCALWSDQGTVIAASIEQAKTKAHPARRRTNSSSYTEASQDDNKGRRANTSTAATATGRQGDSPTSPKSSVRSFKDHVSSRNAKNS